MIGACGFEEVLKLSLEYTIDCNPGALRRSGEVVNLASSSLMFGWWRKSLF